MKVIYSIFLTSLMFVCATSPDKANDSNLDTDKITRPIDHSVKDIITPIFGYHFIIEGDFNGNGIQDTLVEHYISQSNWKETDKFRCLDVSFMKDEK
ncbi:MAG: hypothetical protein ACI8ZM_003624 [Crocinitomix sp.]|jgi:hypothetical protein